MARHARELTGKRRALPRGRRRAQLRRQRQAAPRRRVRRALDPAGGRRRRRRARRRARGVAQRARRSLARPTDSSDAMQGAYLGPEFSSAQIKEFLDASGCCLSRALGRGVGAADRGAHRRREGGRPLPGPHGVRPTRARQPLDRRRPALAADAVAAESQDQAPRELPALRAGLPGGARRRRTSSSTGPRPTCCSSRPSGGSAVSRRRGDERGLDLTEWVNRPRSDLPAITHVDYSARIQSVSRARRTRASTPCSRPSTRSPAARC